jgi:hypothetical protein
MKMRGNVGKSRGNWGLGEGEGFTKSSPIPKPLRGRNTLQVNKALLICRGATRRYINLFQKKIIHPLVVYL